MHATASINRWKNYTSNKLRYVNCKMLRKASVSDYTSLFRFYANTAPGKAHSNHAFSANDLLDNTAEVTCAVREDRCTSTTGGRNSIITSGRGFARRQQECRATQEEPWLCIRKRNDVGDRRTGEGDASRRRTSNPMTMATTMTATTTERRSSGARNSLSKCSLRNSGGGMRTNKKLGDVLTPWIRGGPARTTSYSELYRRRFS